MARTLKIYGRKLAQARESAFLTADKLAELVSIAAEEKMTGGNIRRIEGEEIAGIFSKNVPHFATALKISTDDFMATIAVPLPAPSTNGDARQKPLDTNYDPYSEKALRDDEPPMFDLPIAAGGWMTVWDNQDAGQYVTPEQIRQDRFRVTVRGDSMKPKYPDGSVVEFRCMKNAEGTPDFERLEVGKNYYVQLDDGTGTFKKLAAIEPDRLILRAINRKYRTPLIAEIARIQKLARAWWKLEAD